LAPWYVLDGTHPAVQKHFEELFRSMNKEWGVTYFKLDANYWATIPHAKYYRKNATRTEAYREGMKAILRGAGPKSFILGCNEPMWPSLGVVHGNRTSMDIAPKFEDFQKVGRENLYRSWQNNKLWWNDPDCILLTPSHSEEVITDNQYMFHAALIYATGGMLLSGDDVGSIPANRMKILRSVAVPTGIAARWNANTFDYGWINDGKLKKLVILNWSKIPKTFTIPIDKPCKVKDFFTGQEVGAFSKKIELKDIAGDYGNVYVVED
jgi:alpha-galactosidase